MLKNGAYGAGQSSWGSGFYGLIEGREKALEMQDKIKRFFNNRVNIFITKTNNKGTEIKWLER